MAKRCGWARRAAVWFAIVLALLWTLFPFYWALVYSVKPTPLEYRPLLLPFVQFRPTLAHWRWEWDARHDIDGLEAGLVNSTVVALATAACSVAVGFAAAIGLGKVRRTWRRGRIVLGLLLLPRLVPPIVTVIPLFLLAVATGLRDTLLALVLAHTVLALPLAVVVLDSGLRDVPRDLIDAASLDGASTARVMLQIVAPLLRPLLLAVGTLSYALSWNEFLLAQTNHVSRAATMPLAVAFLQDRDGVPFTRTGSHLVLIALPPLALALLTQRALARGLSLGAVREGR